MKRLILLCLFINHFTMAESYIDLSFDKLVVAAESNDEVAMGFLAELYEQGRGIEKNQEKAYTWYKKSAELNYAPAQYNLAVLLTNGMINEDFEQALFWAEKAAEQNHISAQFLVASLYAQGKGVYVNKQKAYSWYKRAALQDNTMAQYNLALMLLQGDGVDKDMDKGLEWLAKAANKNHIQAKSVLNLIKNQKK